MYYTNKDNEKLRAMYVLINDDLYKLLDKTSRSSNKSKRSIIEHSLKQFFELHNKNILDFFSGTGAIQ
jgi:hypothetical protein